MYLSIYILERSSQIPEVSFFSLFPLYSSSLSRVTPLSSEKMAEPWLHPTLPSPQLPTLTRQSILASWKESLVFVLWAFPYSQVIVS